MLDFLDVLLLIVVIILLLYIYSIIRVEMEIWSQRVSPYWRRGVVIGIEVLSLILVIFLLFPYPWFPLSFLLSIVFFVYFFVGIYCGKRWPEPSSRWGILLTIPLAAASIIFYIAISIDTTGNKIPIISGIIGMMFLPTIFSYFLALFAGSIGGFVGARETLKQTSELYEAPHNKL